MLSSGSHSIPNLQAFFKKNWEFKPWGLGGSRSYCRTCSSKTFRHDPVSSRSLKLSPLKPLKAEAGGDSEVTAASSAAHQNLHFFSHSPSRGCLCSEVSSCCSHQTQVISLHFLKTHCKVPNIKVSYLFCFLGYLCEAGYLQDRVLENSGAALNFSI